MVLLEQTALDPSTQYTKRPQPKSRAEQTDLNSRFKIPSGQKMDRNLVDQFLLIKYFIDDNKQSQ